MTIIELLYLSLIPSRLMRMTFHASNAHQLSDSFLPPTDGDLEISGTGPKINALVNTWNRLKGLHYLG
jgi:hypothetical protein